MYARCFVKMLQEVCEEWKTGNGVVDFFCDFDYPSPVGLGMGIGAVILGQVFLMIYHYLRVFHSDAVTIQQKDINPKATFFQDMIGHFSRPEGFVLLGSYLSITWMFRLLPETYYSFQGGVDFKMVFAQLVTIDAFQTLMHYGEHKISSSLYKVSHKPHHRFYNPKLFDAFDGSTADTVCMILVPLYITANIVHCNVWEYAAFGVSYSLWLCLIHSEFSHPWDKLFRAVGFGTAGDHHVHHRLFVFNYGHLFMWWDKLLGTYKSPIDVPQFNKNI